MANQCNWLPLLTPLAGKVWLVQEDLAVGAWRPVDKNDIDSDPILAESFKEWRNGI